MEWKFFEIVDGERKPVVYPDEFVVEGAHLRISSAAPAPTFRALVECLQGPFEIAYDLFEDDQDREGRYLSPPVDLMMVRDFLAAYGEFLETDGRHDLTISGDGQVTLDQHNLILATGPPGSFLDELRARGFSEGKIKMPYPHGHGFHDRFEETLDRLLAQFDWTRIDLRESA